MMDVRELNVGSFTGTHCYDNTSVIDSSSDEGTPCQSEISLDYFFYEFHFLLSFP